MSKSHANRQVVFVTGGSRGIGKSIAFTLAKAGATVAIAARSTEMLLATQRMIQTETKQKCLAIPCDVSDTRQMQKAVEQTEQDLGPITGLVAAAGAYGNIGPFVESNFEDWEKSLSTNLKGTVLAVHLVGRSMMKRKYGRIVLFSGGGEGPLPNFSSYVTSKGALWRFTETVGAELAAHQVYMNAIAPGAVNTQFLDDVLAAGPGRVGPAFYKKALEQQKSGGQSPEKASQLCMYLLSDKSRGLYGKVLSAIWDQYDQWTDLEKISSSQLYTMRRVTQ